MFFTPATRIPRAPVRKFNERSPIGRKHGRHITSTDAKGKFCTFRNVIMKNYNTDGSFGRETRNIDAALSVCLEDIEFRKRTFDHTSHDIISNHKFILDAARILALFVNRLRKLSSDGYDIGAYLPNLEKYTEQISEAVPAFFEGSKAARKVLIAKIQHFGETGDETFTTPLKMGELNKDLTKLKLS